MKKLCAWMVMAFVAAGCGGGGGGGSGATVLPAIAVAPASISIAGTANTANPAAQSVTVSNAGGGTLAAPNVSITYDAGAANWLTASVSGTGPTYTIAVQASIAGLSAGTYRATLAVSSAGAANSPLSVPVTMTLAQAPLNTVFSRQLSNSPAVVVTLARQNNAAIPISSGGGASIEFDTRVDSSGGRLAGVFTSAFPTTTPGMANVALPPGEYPLHLVMPPGTNIGDLDTKVRVGANTNYFSFRTAQQNWSISSTVAFTQVQITIYECDANGKVNWGTPARGIFPIVLDVTEPTIPSTTSLSNLTVSTELFKGKYRALVQATSASATPIAPFVTNVFDVQGDGATETTPIALSGAGNILNLNLVDGTRVIPTNTFWVDLFDPETLIYLGSANNGVTGSNISKAVGAITDVLAVLSEYSGTPFPTWNQVAARRFQGLTPATIVNWSRHSVTGAIKPPDGSTLTDDPASLVVASAQSGLAAPFDTVGEVSAVVSFPVGTYSLRLFEGAYRVSPVNVKGFPDVQEVALSVTADSAQDLTVAPGGVITGRIQTEANGDLAGVHVAASAADTSEIVAEATTGADGTYALSVPFGSYDLYVGGDSSIPGARLTGIVVGQTSPTFTKNVRQYQINGRIVDGNQTGMDAAITGPGVVAGTPNRNTVTASTLGVYQIKMFEGENWLWIQPPTSKASLGFAFEPNVLIDATTILTR